MFDWNHGTSYSFQWQSCGKLNMKMSFAGKEAWCSGRFPQKLWKRFMTWKLTWTFFEDYRKNRPTSYDFGGNIIRNSWASLLTATTTIRSGQNGSFLHRKGTKRPKVRDASFEFAALFHSPIDFSSKRSRSYIVLALIKVRISFISHRYSLSNQQNEHGFLLPKPAKKTTMACQKIPLWLIFVKSLKTQPRQVVYLRLLLAKCVNCCTTHLEVTGEVKTTDKSRTLWFEK